MLEVPHASVTMGHEIGKGAFGRVFIARATNICGRIGTQMVAVKQLKSECHGREFMDDVMGYMNVCVWERFTCLLRIVYAPARVLNQLSALRPQRLTFFVVVLAQRCPCETTVENFCACCI